MTATLRDDAVVLSGRCAVVDAEVLLGLLIEQPDAVVDISEATALHTAVWQVLMALSPAIRGAIGDEFATNWLTPRILDGKVKGRQAPELVSLKIGA